MKPTRSAGFRVRSLCRSSLMGRYLLTHFAPRSSRSNASLGRTVRHDRTDHERFTPRGLQSRSSILRLAFMTSPGLARARSRSRFRRALPRLPLLDHRLEAWVLAEIREVAVGVRPLVVVVSGREPLLEVLEAVLDVALERVEAGEVVVAVLEISGERLGSELLLQ